MYFHPGFIESCHEPEQDVSYYEKETARLPDYSCAKEYKVCSDKFCQNLRTGGFIRCGNSGDREFVIRNGGLDGLKNNGDTSRENQIRIKGHCCVFCFGQPCDDKHLKRRWTCCKKIRVGTIIDMLEINGCEEVYNITCNVKS